jgi:ABC-type Fe3+ transport system permease subunit
MSRRKRKPRHKPCVKPQPPRYVDVLGWWVPVMVFLVALIYLVYDDITRNGDATRLTAEYQPITKSMSLGGIALVILVFFVIGVHELVRVYRHKHSESEDT